MICGMGNNGQMSDRIKNINLTGLLHSSNTLEVKIFWETDSNSYDEW